MEVSKCCIVEEEEQNAKKAQSARESTLGISLVSERNGDRKKKKEKLSFWVRTQPSEQAHQWYMLEALQVTASEEQILGKISTLFHQGNE